MAPISWFIWSSRFRFRSAETRPEDHEPHVERGGAGSLLHACLGAGLGGQFLALGSSGILFRNTGTCNMHIYIHIYIYTHMYLYCMYNIYIYNNIYIYIFISIYTKFHSEICVYAYMKK